MPPSEQPASSFPTPAKTEPSSPSACNKDLQEHGFDAWLDTQRIGGGAVWSTEIEREIDTRQVMVALLSPGSYESEICRAEQLRALDKGNRVIPVLAVKGADRPIYLYARQYRDFTDPATTTQGLDELIADIRGDATATLPDNLSQDARHLPHRPAARGQLPGAARSPARAARCAVCRRPPPAHRPHRAGRHGRHRQDGAGQGRSPRTKWCSGLSPTASSGSPPAKRRKRDFIEEMREVAKALGDDLSRYDNALACEHQYRTTIANKAALIVVDDVWSKSDIEPLLAESPRSRFLFTTRDASIGRFVSAREHRADLLDHAQSRELLASWADGRLRNCRRRRTR